MRCPLCSSTEMHLIAVRENVPVLQNVICKTDAKAKAFPVGKIQLFQCASCKFVTNAVFDQVAYGEDYENYQGCSRSFSEYMDTRAKRIADCADTLSGSTLIVEIGCGQGTFLQRILHYMKKECDGLGFDPAYRGTATDRRVRYVSEYFVGGVIKSYINHPYQHILLVSRHTIEHIPDPHMLVRECAAVDAEDVRLFLETPNVHWILENVAFEDIVYEHCSFFSPEALVELLKEHDFTPTYFTNTFGGQYMCIEAKKILSVQGSTERYAQQENRFSVEWQERLRAWNQQERSVFVWGAGAKGVAFLNLLDPSAHLVKAVIDINPQKQGHFLVGTGHRIVSPEVLRTCPEEVVVIVMNEQYRQEIERQCESICTKGTIVFHTLHA